MAPPSPGRHGTDLTFLQFLQSNETYVALAFVLEAPMIIPDILTSFEIKSACKTYFHYHLRTRN